MRESNGVGLVNKKITGLSHKHHGLLCEKMHQPQDQTQNPTDLYVGCKQRRF